MRRFTFAFALVAAAFTLGAQGQGRFTVVEATIPQMQAAMAKGQVTSRQLVEQYLMRLGLYEDRLNAALAVNPRALQEADTLDRERAQGKLRGPLHGIPVALKDNIHTTDMPTTGGALAIECVGVLQRPRIDRQCGVQPILIEAEAHQILFDELTRGHLPFGHRRLHLRNRGFHHREASRSLRAKRARRDDQRESKCGSFHAGYSTGRAPLDGVPYV